MIASRDLFDRLAHDTKAIFARDPDVLLPGDRRVVPHQGGGRVEGRARRRAAPHPQLRPHRRPRARGGDASTGASATAKPSRSACWRPPTSRVARGALAERERQALAQLIAQLGPLPAVADLPIAEVLDAIRRDKKVVNGRLHFVLAIEIGATMTVDDVTEDELRGVLKRLGLKG